jgi:transposase-like protein
MTDNEYLKVIKHAEKLWNDGPVCECPMCGASTPIFIGTLGNREHYRCRDCHYDYSILADPS